jgi:hypothetical protein
VNTKKSAINWISILELWELALLIRVGTNKINSAVKARAIK